LQKENGFSLFEKNNFLYLCRNMLNLERNNKLKILN
jgi:hypothetical protein